MVKALVEHRKRLLRLENVVGVGVGHKRVDGRSEGERAIIVLVREKKPAEDIPQAQAIPEKLGTHSTDVIEIGDVRLLSNTARLRPAAPGCSIGHFRVSAGTFGCVVRDRLSGRLLMLSNNHVLANITDGKDGRAERGDPILQPGAYDDGRDPDDIIARLERWWPLYRTAAKATCPVALAAESTLNRVLKTVRPRYSVHFSRLLANENLVDAALALPVAERVVASTILDIGMPLGQSNGYPGMTVKKSGRSSGLTKGTVMVIGATLNVSMGDIGEAVFTDQVITTAMGRPGDSGSLILDEHNRAVGLLAAGSDKATVCNAISNVLECLDVSLVTAG